jgi:hypothetical protein
MGGKGESLVPSYTRGSSLAPGPGRPKRISGSEHPPADFWQFRTSRVGVLGHFAHTTYTILDSGIYGLEFILESHFAHTM